VSPVRKPPLPDREISTRFGNDRLAAARDLATIAGGLLQLSDSALLVIALPSDGWGERAPVLLWDHMLRLRTDRTQSLWDTPTYAPAMTALCIAADTLFDQLTATRPFQLEGKYRGLDLCVVTDGVGVGLSGTAPAHHDDDGSWLLDLAGGSAPCDSARGESLHGDGSNARRSHRTARAAQILPLAPTGPWALLSADARDASHH